MRINLAKSAGFCFGVKRALKIALDSASCADDIEMLGDIVHNNNVVKQVNKAGIKTITRLHCGKNKKLLIRAHGSSLKTLRKARSLGYEIVDATCPMVCEIHKIAIKMERNGYNIIVIGDKKHDEVLGIVGQLKSKVLVIDAKEKVPFVKWNKVAIVVQSTQDTDKVQKVVDQLKKNIKNVQFFNTICNPTITKQKEIKSMACANDVMVIIGSKTSANTKRLHEISKSINKCSYWIESKSQIKSNWFSQVKTVGITAGASTPDDTTSDVIKYIKNL
ncbi:MAG: 4-hydroxy-3-methylbut-2-enyl diphosphate reductase [Candidatus Omnitrophica bacterium]|nr:4-hydroxy-3-methylbut-2-enyl diphosphate reductase [Candidatus Omnitrophota bacterium]